MITLWRHLRDNSGCLYVPEGVVAYILYISTARRQMAWHKQLKKTTTNAQTQGYFVL